MPKSVVSLDAYVLPDDHRIFKVSPGKTYRFYKEVKRSNAIFLDVRGLDDLDGHPVTWSDQEIVKVIAADRWDRELKSRDRGNEPKGSKAVNRTDRTRLGFLKALLGDAQKGDLVIVPVEGYINDVLIGELLDEPWDTKSIVAQDGDDGEFTYIGRRVEWKAAQPKRFFSGGMIKALHTQTAVFQIGRSLHEEVYRLAYRNFVYRGHFVAEFHTGKARFTSEDSAVLSAWLNGFDYLRSRLGKGGALPNSFYEMGLSKVPDSAAADLTINVNSPGVYVLKSSGGFALALMGMFALTGCDSKTVVDNGVTVELKTVGVGANDAGTAIEECINDMAVALGEARLDQASDLCGRAERDAKVTTAASLKTGLKASK
ncbi:hypothetical protein HME9302_01503 [Alteripontixanthobacter maritimus]|uniref:Uncharacterized protein n=1 Tax=Alteripontixanthobacter maritimus TaxID=2161824 RepID=A0A369Q744_9SPHN|nr:hypothetical protein [Alteripontixanthobacter maritimus]RDC60302.1 hypothetical protein HME9302_01503 [Alteripontixanthobacter maritimus]